MTSYFLELNKFHLIFPFSIQSLGHFPPSWLGLCPSLFIPLWKSAGPLDYNLLQLFRVRVDNVLRYAWQNAYFEMISSYFCCLRRYSIAIYLPALHSSIIQRDLGLKSKCSCADVFNINSQALYLQCINLETDEDPPQKMSHKLFIFVGLYFSTVSAGRMNFRLYKTMLIKAHSVLFSHNPTLLMSNRQHLKYFRNVYCVTTDHSKDQDMRACHITTN